MACKGVLSAAAGDSESRWARFPWVCVAATRPATRICSWRASTTEPRSES